MPVNTEGGCFQTGGFQDGFHGNRHFEAGAQSVVRRLVRTETALSGGALWLAWSWLVAWLVLASKPGPCVGLLAIHCPTLAVQWSHALAQFCAIVPQTWGMAGEKPAHGPHYRPQLDLNQFAETGKLAFTAPPPPCVSFRPVRDPAAAVLVLYRRYTIILVLRNE